MYLNQFSVRLLQGVERNGCVELEHNTQYSLILRNARNVQCDAKVEIDGKHVGTWRIPSRENITLERPAHDTGRFTFYKTGTQEAYQAGIDEYNPDLGLVSVTFTPELYTAPVVKTIEPEVVYRGASFSTPVSKGGLSGGGTGLSGQSSQHFHNARKIVLDYSQTTVINIRLVCRENGPRPLTSYSTPVPPRV